jgi:L-2-hydroxycarboxylate dehydrogenase (NAD+)
MVSIVAATFAFVPVRDASPMRMDTLARGNLQSACKDLVLGETSSTALIEGELGFWQVVGVKGMETATRKANDTDIGLVGIVNSGQLGALIHFIMMALQASSAEGWNAGG